MSSRSSRSFRTLGVVLGAGAIALVAVAQESRQPPAAPAGQPPAPRTPGERAPGERGPGGAGGGRQQASLEATMKGMNRAFRQLKDSVGAAASKDENLRLIGDIQRGVVQSKGMTPPGKGVADEKKAAHTEEYRRVQIELLKLTIDLESQTMDGKVKDAEATFAKVEKLKDEAHTKFGGSEHDK